MKLKFVFKNCWTTSLPGYISSLCEMKNTGVAGHVSSKMYVPCIIKFLPVTSVRQTILLKLRDMYKIETLVDEKHRAVKNFEA